MNPYIVTISREVGHGVAPEADGAMIEAPVFEEEVISHRAVATLEEARQAAQDAIDNGPAIHSYNYWRRLCEEAKIPDVHGGTVGPLPDGTTINVEWTDWEALRVTDDIITPAVASGKGNWPDSHIRAARKALIDSYNAHHQKEESK